MNNDHTIELSLPNALGYERIAMGGLASFAQGVGFKQERIEDIKTAVAEACINAVQHGNKYYPDARVIVTMKFENGTFNIAVMDKGDGIPNLPKDPDIDKIIKELEPTTGFGLFLIKKLVDQVEFNEMTSQGHVVRMIFQKRV
jgi:serine/threonine-protein kinase RsbW